MQQHPYPGVDPSLQYERRLSHMHDTPTQRLCYALGLIIGLTTGIIIISSVANSHSSHPVAPIPVRAYAY